EWFLALFAGQVHLGGQPATGATQAVVGWFGVYPARLVLLEAPLFAAPAACWCARATVEYRHVPGNQPLPVGPGLQLGQDPLPRAVALPAPQQAVDGLPRPVPSRNIAPRRTGTGTPPDAVDELTLGPQRRVT